MSHMHERDIGTIVVSSISLVVISTVHRTEFPIANIIGGVRYETWVASTGGDSSGVALTWDTAD